MFESVAMDQASETAGVGGLGLIDAELGPGKRECRTRCPAQFNHDSSAA